MSTNRYITTNQDSVSTGNGDNTFVAPGVTVNFGIDMRGNDGAGGGDQTVTVYGTLFGALDDYFTDKSGGDQIFIGPTGSVNSYSSDVIIIGGGGNIIVNAGTLSAMSYGNVFYLLGSVGAHQSEGNIITNTGTISGTSLHPDRSWADATIYVQSAASVTLTNTGSILSATGYAMTLNAGQDSVANSGFIGGGVMLGNGNDLFDSRLGTITGPILAGDGDDTIFGSKGDDTIVGGDGNDRIDGSTGADDMIGGFADDTYFVDNTGDVVDENNATYGGGGNNTIYASISFDLGNPTQVIGRVQTLVLTGAADINAIGTTQGETISGNIGDNVIRGGGGGDRLNGGGGGDRLIAGNGTGSILSGGPGDDTLRGGNGADTLNGGSGADTMYGGAGSDTYIFDDLGDVANEAVAGSGGTDRVLASVSVSLADTVHVKGAIENLTLQGSAAISGTGNGLANVIVGNAGPNVIDGGLGNDILTGGAGADRFTFTTSLNSATNRDTITDFQHGTDKIVLDNAVFTALTKTGALAAANFAINTPKDANDFIVYNTSSGALFYDRNGNGAAASVQFASLKGVPGLTQTDFLVI